MIEDRRKCGPLPLCCLSQNGAEKEEDEEAEKKFTWKYIISVESL